LLQVDLFSKILFKEHNAKNICRTAISGKEQNLNKQMAEFWDFHTFPVLYVHSGEIQYFFRSCKPVSQFNTFKTAWEPVHGIGL